MLLQAQEVKFISVNSSVDSLENLSFKRLPKLLEKDSITTDTLAEPAKWMVKLQRKLSKQQRQDSNIYIFFCSSETDSITAFLPLSGKYGYVLFDSSKTSVLELERLQLRLSTHKYQWDNIHNPEALLFAFAQDDSAGASKFTIINDAYTDLFNYMYENYMEEEKLEITDMSGYDGEGDFKNWTLNTGDFNATSILEQIRNTATNSQIPDLTLIENQISTSIVPFNDKNIPIVVYSPVGKVSGVSKNWYTDVDAFNNGKFYYCEERVADDYIVLALYAKEADYPLAPSLILQMEDDETNLKEKWLRNLLILEPRNSDATPLSDSDLKKLFPSLVDAEQATLDDRKNYWAYVSTNMKTLFTKCAGEDEILDYYNDKAISASSHNNSGKQMITGFREGANDFAYYDKVYINLEFEIQGIKYNAAAHNFSGGNKKTYNAANRPTIKSIEDLTNAKLVKSVTTPNYVLIAFYEAEGNDPFIVYQMNGTDDGIMGVWLNYFNIVENEEKVEDLNETIVDAQDEDYEGIVDLEKKLTNETVFARELEIENKKFDIYIERSGKVEDDNSKVYLFTSEEKTKIFGFDGEFTSFTLTNNSGGITKLSVPTTQANDFVALVLKPELGHAANIRAICERINQAGVKQETSVDFSAFDAVMADKYDLWNAVPNVKIGETVFDFRAYQVYNESDKNIVLANLVEKTDNPNITEKFGYRLEFKNKDRKTVVSLNVKKEQFEELKEYLIPTRALPGNPLIKMEIVGTVNTTKIGGTYGCTRYTDKLEAQNCSTWSSNIAGFPTVTDKNKVHDGIDLLAESGTPVYAMYDGHATTHSSTTLGTYVLIKSGNNQHKLNITAENIWVSYGHLSTSEDLNNKEVKQGHLIGYTGNTGSTAKNIAVWRHHLHLTVYVGGTSKFKRMNPINYITTKFDSNGNKKN